MLHHWHGTIDLIQKALAEDEVAIDHTSALLPDDITSEALMMPKASGMLAGVDVALEVFRQTAPSLETETLVTDGSHVEQVVKVDGWNKFVIRCQGPRIQIWVNGLAAIDYREQEEGIAVTGIIGLQIHGGPPAEASYRKIRIKTLSVK